MQPLDSHQHFPSTFDAAKDLGNHYFQTGEFETAEKYYVQALGCKDASITDQVIACGNLAQCNIRRGRPREALSWCERALADDPSHVKNNYRKAVALELMGNFEAAKASLQRADKAMQDGVSATSQLQSDIKQKLGNVTARLEEQQSRERTAKAERRLAHDEEVARSRPTVPQTCLAPRETIQLNIKEAGAKGYREYDWAPWLQQRLHERCTGDPDAPDRLRANTLRGLCMAYVPDRLPIGWPVKPGSPEAEVAPLLKMVTHGMPGMPPLPPTGKEVADQLASRIVRGDLAQWRNGDRGGLRYEFRVHIWWRGVESALDGEAHVMEGTIDLEVVDEMEPAKWSLDVSRDPGCRSKANQKQPSDEAVKRLLGGAQQLGQITRSVVKDLIAKLESKANDEISGEA